MKNLKDFELKILELTEPFPNDISPSTALFVKSHVEYLSKHSDVTLCVFVRLLPPKSFLKSFHDMKKWLKHTVLRCKVKYVKSKDYTILYIPYASLPRPTFEFMNIKLLKIFYWRKIYQIAVKFKPDVVIVHWASPLSFLAWKVASKIGVPLVIDVHEDPDNIEIYFPCLKRIWLKALRLADAIIVHSEVNKNKLINLGIESQKIFKVYLGIDNIFRESEKITIRGNKKSNNFTILSVSHLSNPCKRIDDLLYSFVEVKRMYPEVKLVIVGDGRLRESLKKLSSALGVENSVDFKGALSPRGVREEMLKADLFVLPSVRESFGLVFVEALALGLPVIGYKEAGAIKELSDLNVPIIKLDEVNPQSISQAISEVYTRYNEIKEGVDRYREKIVERFSWESHAVSYTELLDKIRKSKRIRG